MGAEAADVRRHRRATHVSVKDPTVPARLQYEGVRVREGTNDYAHVETIHDHDIVAHRKAR